MRKTIIKALPFIFMFALSAGSVFMSCATTQPGSGNPGKEEFITLNTGKSDDGRILTTWVFSRIESVMVVDYHDRSRKMEIRPEEWSYDSGTTEIKILKKIPYDECIVHLEGYNHFPNTFVLAGSKTGGDILVILENRLAIEGYDYRIENEGGKIVFRDDISLSDSQWHIQYETPNGQSSIGEWEPEDMDQMAYLEAGHRKRFLDRWYDTQETLWFFEGPFSADEPPFLVSRKPSQEELRLFKSHPVSVLKYRLDTSDAKLSRELGFRTALPEMISFAEREEEITISGKLIDEYAREGKLHRELYTIFDVTRQGKEGRMFELIMSKTLPDKGMKEEDEWIIGEETFDLAFPVRVVRSWGMRTSSMEGKPEAVRLSSWSWEDNGIHFSVTSDTSDDDLCMLFISRIISYRNGKK